MSIDVFGALNPQAGKLCHCRQRRDNGTMLLVILIGLRAKCDRIDPDPSPVALITTGEISLTKKRQRCHGQGAGKFRIRRAPIQQSQKGLAFCCGTEP
jgi:hypothetical protein